MKSNAHVRTTDMWEWEAMMDAAALIKRAWHVDFVLNCFSYMSFIYEQTSAQYTHRYKFVFPAPIFFRFIKKNAMYNSS